MTTAVEFSRPINLLQGLTDPSADVVIEPTSEERDALARRFGLESLGFMRIQLRLRSGSRGEVAVNGHLTADLVQLCVVSLELVPARIETEFDVVYSSVAEEPTHEDPLAEADPPERLPEDGVVDMGEVAAQFFGLAIDPYPRKPGAALPAGRKAAEAPPTDNPFAVLKALKTKD